MMLRRRKEMGVKSPEGMIAIVQGLDEGARLSITLADTRQLECGPQRKALMSSSHHSPTLPQVSLGAQTSPLSRRHSGTHLTRTATYPSFQVYGSGGTASPPVAMTSQLNPVEVHRRLNELQATLHSNGHCSRDRRRARATSPPRLQPAAQASVHPVRAELSFMADIGTTSSNNTRTRASTAFVESLRKYPTPAERSVSADLIQRLLLYTQAKNNSNSLRVTRHTKSVRSYTKQSSDSSGVKRKSSKNVQTYTRSRQNSPLPDASAICGKSEKKRSVVSPSKSERVNIGSEDTASAMYDYLKVGSSGRFVPRFTDVRYLNDVTNYVRDALRQFYADQSRSQVCPTIADRYHRHRREYHRAETGTETVDERNHAVQTPPCLRRMSKSCHGAGPSGSFVSDIRMRTEKRMMKVRQRFCDICRDPAPCTCPENQTLSSAGRKKFLQLYEPVKKMITQTIESTSCTCLSKLDNIIDEWLQEVPIRGSCTKYETERRDRVVDALKTSIKQHILEESECRELITRCLDKLPLWLPRDVSSRLKFKENLTDTLLERLEMIRDLKERLDDHGKMEDRISEVVKIWIRDVPFKTETPLNRDLIARDLTNKLKCISSSTEKTKLRDAYKDITLKELEQLPIDCGSEEKVKLALKLADWCTDAVDSIYGLIDKPLFLPGTNIDMKSPTKNLDDEMKNIMANANTKNLDDEMKNIMANANPENAWDALKAAALKHLPLNLSSEEREALAAQRADELISNMFEEIVRSWIETVPFEQNSNVNKEKFGDDLIMKLKIVEATEEPETLKTALKNVVVKELDKLPVVGNSSEKGKLAVNLAGELEKLPNVKDRLKDVIRRWIKNVPLLPLPTVDKVKVINDLTKNLKDKLKITKPEEAWDDLKKIALQELKELPVNCSNTQTESLAEQLADSIVSDIFDDAVWNWVSSLPFDANAHVNKEKLGADLNKKFRQLVSLTDPRNVIKVVALKELNKLPLQCSMSEKENNAEAFADELDCLPKKRDEFSNIVKEWVNKVPFTLTPPVDSDVVANKLTKKLKYVIVYSSDKPKEKKDALTAATLNVLNEYPLKCEPKEKEKLAESLAEKLYKLPCSDLQLDEAQQMALKMLMKCPEFAEMNDQEVINSVKKLADQIRAMQTDGLDSKEIDKTMESALNNLITQFKKLHPTYEINVTDWLKGVTAILSREERERVVKEALAKIGQLRSEEISDDDLREVIQEDIERQIHQIFEKKKEVNPRAKQKLADKLCKEIFDTIEGVAAARKEKLIPSLKKDIITWLFDNPQIAGTKFADVQKNEDYGQEIAEIIVDLQGKGISSIEIKNKVHENIIEKLNTGFEGKKKHLDTETKNKLAEELLGKFMISAKLPSTPKETKQESMDHAEKLQKKIKHPVLSKTDSTEKINTDEKKNMISAQLPSTPKETKQESMDHAEKLQKKIKQPVVSKTDGTEKRNTDEKKKLNIDPKFKKSKEKSVQIQMVNDITGNLDKKFENTRGDTDTSKKRKLAKPLLIKLNLRLDKYITPTLSEESFKMNVTDSTSPFHKQVKKVVKDWIDNALELAPASPFEEMANDKLLQELTKKITSLRAQDLNNKQFKRQIIPEIKSKVDEAFSIRGKKIDSKTKRQLANHLLKNIDNIHNQGEFTSSIGTIQSHYPSSTPESETSSSSNSTESSQRTTESESDGSTLSSSTEKPTRRNIAIQNEIKAWIKDIPELSGNTPASPEICEKLTQDLFKTLNDLKTSDLDNKKVWKNMQNEIKDKLNAAFSSEGEKLDMVSKFKLANQLLERIKHKIPSSVSFDEQSVRPPSQAKTFQDIIKAWVNDVKEIKPGNSRERKQNRKLIRNLTKMLKNQLSFDQGDIKTNEKVLEEIKRQLSMAIAAKNNNLEPRYVAEMSENLLNKLAASSKFSTALGEKTESVEETADSITPPKTENAQKIKKQKESATSYDYFKQNRFGEQEKTPNLKGKNVSTKQLMDNNFHLSEKQNKLEGELKKDIVEYLNNNTVFGIITTPDQKKDIQNVGKQLARTLNKNDSEDLKRLSVRNKLLADIKCQLDSVFTRNGEPLTLKTRDKLAEGLMHQIEESFERFDKQAKSNVIKNNIFKWIENVPELANSNTQSKLNNKKIIDALANDLTNVTSANANDDRTRNILLSKIKNQLQNIQSGKSEPLDDTTRQKLAEELLDNITESARKPEMSSETEAHEYKKYTKDWFESIPELSLAIATDDKGKKNVIKAIVKDLKNIKRGDMDVDGFQEKIKSIVMDHLESFLQNKHIKIDPKTRKELVAKHAENIVHSNQHCDKISDPSRRALEKTLADWHKDIPQLKASSFEITKISEKLAQKIIELQLSSKNQDEFRERLKILVGEYLVSAFDKQTEPLNYKTKTKLVNKLLNQIDKINALDNLSQKHDVAKEVTDWFYETPEYIDNTNKKKIENVSRNIAKSFNHLQPEDAHNKATRNSIVKNIKDQLEFVLNEKSQDLDINTKYMLANKLFRRVLDTVEKDEKIIDVPKVFQKDILSWLESITETASTSASGRKENMKRSQTLAKKLADLQEREPDDKKRQQFMLEDINDELDDLLNRRDYKLPSKEKKILSDMLLNKIINSAKIAERGKTPKQSYVDDSQMSDQDIFSNRPLKIGKKKWKTKPIPRQSDYLKGFINDLGKRRKSSAQFTPNSEIYYLEGSNGTENKIPKHSSKQEISKEIDPEVQAMITDVIVTNLEKIHTPEVANIKKTICAILESDGGLPEDESKRLANSIIQQAQSKAKEALESDVYLSELLKQDIKNILKESGIKEEHQTVLEPYLMDLVFDKLLHGALDDKSRADIVKLIQEHGDVTPEEAKELLGKLIGKTNEMLKTTENMNYRNEKEPSASNLRGEKAKKETIQPKFTESHDTEDSNRIEDVIKNWLNVLPIDSDCLSDENFKETMVKDLAGDIIDRQQYLQHNPDVKLTDNEELEHLKNQCSKWMNKFLEADDLDVALSREDELIAALKEITVPNLAKVGKVASVLAKGKIPTFKDALEDNIKTWASNLPSNIQPTVDEDEFNELVQDLALKIQKYKGHPDSEELISKEIAEILPLIYEDLDEDEIKRLESSLFNQLQKKGFTDDTWVPSQDTTQFVEENLNGSIQDWLKQLPLYQKASPLEKREQELAAEEMSRAIKRALDVARLNPNLDPDELMKDEIIKHLRNVIKEPELKNDEEFLENTANNLLHHLKAQQMFQDSTGRFETSSINLLDSAIRDWVSKLPVEPKTQSEQRQLENANKDFLGRLKQLRIKYHPSSPQHDDAIQKEGMKFLQLVLKDPFKRTDESYLNKTVNELVKILQGVPVQPIRDMRDNVKPFKSPADTLYEYVEEWCDNLPIQGESEKVRSIKQNLASKAINKIGEINMNPDIFHDDALYQDLLQDELAYLLEEVPGNPELNKYLPALEKDLISKVMEARQRMLDELAGKAYKQQLRDTISSSMPVPGSLTVDEQASLELLKDKLADAFITLHYSQDNEDERYKYRKKISSEVDRFCKDLLMHYPCARIDTNKLKRDLHNALLRVPVPRDDSMKSEVEQVKIRDIIYEWMKEIPLRQETGMEKVHRYKLAAVLAKRLHDIEMENEYNPYLDNDTKMSEEILKFLKKLPLMLHQEIQIPELVEKLKYRLKDSEDFRKFISMRRSKSIETQADMCTRYPCTLNESDQAHLLRIKERAKSPCVKDTAVCSPLANIGSQTDHTSHWLQQRTCPGVKRVPSKITCCEAPKKKDASCMTPTPSPCHMPRQTSCDVPKRPCPKSRPNICNIPTPSPYRMSQQTPVDMSTQSPCDLPTPSPCHIYPRVVVKEYIWDETDPWRPSDIIPFDRQRKSQEEPRYSFQGQPRISQGEPRLSSQGEPRHSLQGILTAPPKVTRTTETAEPTRTFNISPSASIDQQYNPYYPYQTPQAGQKPGPSTQPPLYTPESCFCRPSQEREIPCRTSKPCTPDISSGEERTKPGPSRCRRPSPDSTDRDSYPFGKKGKNNQRRRQKGRTEDETEWSSMRFNADDDLWRPCWRPPVCSGQELPNLRRRERIQEKSKCKCKERILITCKGGGNRYIDVCQSCGTSCPHPRYLYFTK